MKDVTEHNSQRQAIGGLLPPFPLCVHRVSVVKDLDHRDAMDTEIQFSKPNHCQP
jgi:hypothetical protein